MHEWGGEEDEWTTTKKTECKHSFTYRNKSVKLTGILRCMELGEARSFLYTFLMYISQKLSVENYYPLSFTYEEMDWERWLKTPAPQFWPHSFYSYLCLPHCSALSPPKRKIHLGNPIKMIQQLEEEDRSRLREVGRASHTASGCDARFAPPHNAAGHLPARKEHLKWPSGHSHPR